MSKNSWAQSDDKFSGSARDSDAPQGQVQDDSYAGNRDEKEPIPVLGDNDAIEDPVNARNADSDKQLEQDDKEAIDKSNVVKDRTRGAKPMAGSYEEPSDEQLGLTE